VRGVRGRAARGEERRGGGKEEETINNGRLPLRRKATRAKERVHKCTSTYILV
jgi:hypothetical protein